MAGESPSKPWWRRLFGTRSERAAARFLKRLGYRIVAQNYSCPQGELDLVAVDGVCVVFVEVRWRRNRDFGLPEETFDHRKRRHVWSAAMRVIAVGTLPGGVRLPLLPVRLDLIVVEPPLRPDQAPRLRHHRNVSLD